MLNVQAVTKSAAFRSPARQECEGIMQRIYNERPDYWPYGLNVDQHSDVYMVREASSRQPVGFVGWQALNEDGVKVGYYSIGILPEHRGKGLAKQAVEGILAEKRASVDAVRAFVMPHNLPSLKLAASLGIEVTHNA
jgi:RimJ/RimL family protein N-acetyltransferase